MADNEYLAWCAVGRCPSEMGDMGERGRTEIEAQQKLVAKMEKNPDWLGED